MTDWNESGERESPRSRLRKGLPLRDEAGTRQGEARGEWERTFDAIDDFVTILDPDLRVIRMNRAIAEAFRIDRTRTSRIHCYELFWGKRSPCNKCPASLVLEDRRTHRAEFRNRALDKTFLVSASPILDQTGQLVGMVYVTRDISDRRRAEDALRAAHDELEARVAERTSELTRANARLQEQIAERRRAEALLSEQARELDSKSRTLEEANIALRVMLKAREEDRKELEDIIVSNIRELAFPHLSRLRSSRLSPEQTALLDVVRAKLDDVVSPFSRRLSSRQLSFTPQEIVTADLIKGGHGSKDIAGILGVSLRTVEFHRENIRRKLGLRSRRINLRSHLLSLE